jgi:hypothetical protein
MRHGKKLRKEKNIVFFAIAGSGARQGTGQGRQDEELFR